jgi:hypothetical protein
MKYFSERTPHFRGWPLCRSDLGKVFHCFFFARTKLLYLSRQLFLIAAGGMIACSRGDRETRLRHAVQVLPDTGAVALLKVDFAARIRAARREESIEPEIAFDTVKSDAVRGLKYVTAQWYSRELSHWMLERTAAVTKREVMLLNGVPDWLTAVHGWTPHRDYMAIHACSEVVLYVMTPPSHFEPKVVYGSRNEPEFQNAVQQSLLRKRMVPPSVELSGLNAWIVTLWVVSADAPRKFRCTFGRTSSSLLVTAVDSINTPAQP